MRFNLIKTNSDFVSLESRTCSIMVLVLKLLQYGQMLQNYEKILYLQRA